MLKTKLSRAYFSHVVMQKRIKTVVNISKHSETSPVNFTDGRVRVTGWQTIFLEEAIENVLWDHRILRHRGDVKTQGESKKGQEEPFRPRFDRY